MAKNNKQIAIPEDLGPRARQVLEYVFEHPKASVKDIAEAMGLSANRIYRIKAHPKFQACFPAMARRKLKEAVPELTGRFLELARQNENLGVAEKVVSRALDSQKVLETPPQMQTNVFVNLNTNDLMQKVERLQELGKTSIDTDAVDAPDTTTPL